MPNKLLQGDDLVKYLDELETTGMEVTKQWHSMWREAIEYVWNEQLGHITDRNPDWDYIQINHIYPLMMQGIAKLSKNNPRILGRPWNDDDAEWSEIWQGLVQYTWEQVLDMRLDCIKVLLDSGTFGYGVGKICWENKVNWDDNQQKWTGDVKHTIVHPANFWADPTATRLKDARNLGTVRQVTLEWAINQWPEFEEELKEEAKKITDKEAQFGGVLFNRTKTQIYENQTAKTLGGKLKSIASMIFGSKKDSVDSQQDYVYISEIYFKDEYTEHIKIEENIPSKILIERGDAIPEEGTGILKTPDGKELDEWPKQTVREYDKPLFPRGRYVLKVGSTILNPEIEDQQYSYSRWPFTVIPYHIIPHMWQGANAVEFAKGSQDMLNSTVSHLVQHVKLHSNPMTIVESGTLKKNKKGKVRQLKNKAGEIILVEKARKDGIRQLPPQQIGTETFTLIQLLKKDIETQSFMNEVAQGATPSKDMSATQAARLDTNSHDMTGLRSVMLDKWIEGTAINIAEVIQKNYEPDRKLRIIGDNDMTRNILFNDDLRRVEWSLEIEPGSTLPFDEEVRKNNYMAAYKLLAEPVANPMLEDMLRVLNIARRDKILSKHQQTQIFKQFVALSQEAMQVMQLPPDKQMLIKPQLEQKVMQLFQQASGLIRK